DVQEVLRGVAFGIVQVQLCQEQRGGSGGTRAPATSQDLQELVAIAVELLEVPVGQHGADHLAYLDHAVHQLDEWHIRARQVRDQRVFQVLDDVRLLLVGEDRVLIEV